MYYVYSHIYIYIYMHSFLVWGHSPESCVLCVVRVRCVCVVYAIIPRNPLSAWPNNQQAPKEVLGTEKPQVSVKRAGGATKRPKTFT